MRAKSQPFDYPNHINSPTVDLSGTNNGILLAANATYRWRVLALQLYFAAATTIEVYFGATAAANRFIYTQNQLVDVVYNEWYYEGEKGEEIRVASTGGAYFGLLTYVGSQDT